VAGAGTDSKARSMNQGDLSRTAKVFMRRTQSEPKSRGTGVRVSVGAMKRGNARGAKGHRKVDAGRKQRCKTNRR
jgi:hypothetical protein